VVNIKKRTMQQKYSPAAMMGVGKPSAVKPLGKPAFTEYKLRVPKNLLKRYNVMKIKAPRPIKFAEIKEANMVRKTKKQVYVEEDGPSMPTHGAGSVYNYDRKEEARKKRRGYIERKVNQDDLPYALRLGGKGGKRYTGKKEPILEHSAYYVLTQCPDGVFEACPVQAWYNFMPDIDYATMSSDEVEHEFSKRDRTLSYFTKKYNFGEGDDGEESSGAPRGKVKLNDDSYGLKIHDDEIALDDLEDDMAMSSDEEGASKPKKNSKKEKDMFRGKGKGKSGDSDEEETIENRESKEVDYMSESSSEDELLEMDDEPDPEKENSGKAKDDLNIFSDSDDEEESKELNDAGKELKAMLKKETGENSDEDDDDEEDEEEEDEDIDNEFSSSAVFMQGKDAKKKKGRSGSSSSSKPGSRSNTPIQADQTDETISKAASTLKEGKGGSKRAHDNASPSGHSKKQKLANAAAAQRSESPKTDAFRTITPAARPSTPADSGNGITEESIRRYLTHKPMTTVDLMRKFKTKKTGLSKEQTVNAIAAILKKIQPHQEKIDGKLYLSIKSKK